MALNFRPSSCSFLPAAHASCNISESTSQKANSQLNVLLLQLTNEFVEVMDGPRSATFRRFRELCVKTYMELRRQRHKIILLVEM
eukprot:52325-Eustigmatos_ZCMA.PRE.1